MKKIHCNKDAGHSIDTGVLLKVAEAIQDINKSALLQEKNECNILPP
ncbi:MAG: hypothetical protein NVV59_06490 [Chitinophagaceae bacterium]|nr:hypothetical protein [Chitinophagaceae bacterium]